MKHCLVALLLLVGTGLASCAAVDAAGRGVERAGEGLQDATHRDVPEDQVTTVPPPPPPSPY